MQSSPSNQSAIKAAKLSHNKAHLNILQQTLPLLKLPSAVSQHAPSLENPVRKTIAHLLANRHILPAHIITPPQFPPHLTDDISTALAQAVATDAEETVDLWNSIAPQDCTVTTPQALPAAIRSVRTEIDRLQRESRQLDVQLHTTRQKAVQMYQSALRAVLQASEEDAAERIRDDAADVARVDVLAARGDATSAKLRLQRAEIAALVYTEDTVRALEAVLERVEQREAILESQLRQQESLLEEYRALGPEFETLVQEFAKASRVLEEKVWSRDELVGGKRNQADT